MIWAVTTWTDREALVFGYVREMPGPVESLADLGVFLALTRLVQRFPWGFASSEITRWHLSALPGWHRRG
jgi:hypothetical protein